jgi:mannose-6-phosphate isomerase-like protein (cupin superfamily)
LPAVGAGRILTRTMDVFRNVAEAIEFRAEKMKKNPLFASERFFCDVYAFEPGQSQGGHHHGGSDKIYFVIEGTGEFRVDDRRAHLSAGAVVYCPACSEHGVENLGPGRLALLVFMAPPPAS